MKQRWNQKAWYMGIITFFVTYIPLALLILILLGWSTLAWRSLLIGLGIGIVVSIPLLVMIYRALYRQSVESPQREEERREYVVPPSPPTFVSSTIPILGPGETGEMTFQQAGEMDIDEFLEGMPPWFTRDMLLPGTPIVMPEDDTTTVVESDGTIHEAYPGAWKRKREEGEEG